MVVLCHDAGSSVSSEQSTDRVRAVLKRPLVPPKQFPEKPSLVRFEEENNKVQLIPHCWGFDQEEEIRQLWYSREDVEEMKKWGRVFAKEVRRRGAINPVENAYGWSQSFAFSLEEESLYYFLRDGNGNDALIKKYSHDFFVWAQRKNTCRGLEHWTSKAYFTARIEYKNEVRRAVLKLKIRGESDEAIAKASIQRSRASRIVARFFGMADAQFKISPSKYPELNHEIMLAYRKSQWVPCPETSLSDHECLDCDEDSLVGQECEEHS